MTDDVRRPPGRVEAGHAGGAAARHLDLDLLNAYLGEELPPADRAAAAGHLGACPACRRELAELRATRTLLRGLPHYAPRRSLRLGPEHARPGQAASAGLGWLARLLPALPVLRAATAAVAVCLLLVTAGGLLADREAEPAPAAVGGPAAEQGAPATGAGGAGGGVTAPAVEVPAEAPAARQREAADEPAGPVLTADEESQSGADDREPAAGDGAAEPAAPEAVVEATAAVGFPAPAAQAPAAPPGAAPAGGAAAPTPAPESAQQEGAASPGRAVSGWRRAQIGFGLLLVPLLVALVAAEAVRLRSR